MGNPDSDSSFQSNEKDEKIIKSVLPRESLINTAVTFLSNKNIQNQDPSLLKRFLIKKGLTEEEASLAFHRFESNKSQENLVAEFSQPQQLPAPPPLVVPPPVPSVWHTVHSIVTTVSSVAGIFYALYWLWKTYISPYLFGRKPKKKPVETSLAELEVAVGGCIADMKSIRSSLQSLTDQRAVDLTNGIVITRIQEVKSEVNSLKALLLNRNQFPATPAPLGGPLSIPAWQMQSCEGEEMCKPEHEGEGEEEGSGSNGTTNGSDSSLEIVKDPIN